VVLGNIFNKWFSLRDQAVPLSRLGCPTGDERDAPGGARAQGFAGGRIYAGLSTGDHYVPAVFVQAIDTLGGESATGVPIADPSDSIGVMQTWLFQQFTRPDYPDLLPSTLEIRGNPPTLWVERQAGDLDPLFFEGVPISANSPTIWQDFSCSGILGPCDVSAPTSDPPIANAGDRFCNGTVFPWRPGQPTDVTPEWVAVVDDYELTPILGLVSNIGMADVDFGMTHDCTIPVVDLPGPAPTDYIIVRSDINVFVRPLHPFRNLIAENTQNPQDKVELEFEYCWFSRGFAGAMEPLPGDLLFAAGRWIIDCGHDRYRSEIHPPAMMAPMRTVMYDGQWATKADIWVNGTYTGDPVQVEIFPPPRPSPDAWLTVSAPRDVEAGFGAIYLETSFVDHSVVQVRFSAPPKYVPVTMWGEMRWENYLTDAREYRGRWHVWWSTGLYP
jgi:hypothetical protein